MSKLSSDSVFKIESEDFGKCAICLQKFPSNQSKAYASKCFHSYCFECLLEWSKVKYSCPLCKIDFDRIIFHITSRLEYKSYFLKTKEIENLPDIISISPEIGLISETHQYSKASWMINTEQAPIEFRIMVYKNNWYVNSNQILKDITLENIDLIDYDNQSEKIECLFYEPVSRFRNVKPEWFEKNPACSHRLTPFLHRELNAISGIFPSGSNGRLCQNARSQLISTIIKLIKKYDIKSDKFYQEISEHIRPLKYARHFQHEFLSFARSICLDLSEYDAKCVYYQDERSIPLLNENNLDKIIPFESIPVNLSRYRLLNKEKNELQLFYDYLEPSQFEVQPSTSRAAEERESIELSEQSSFCEIVTPPRIQTPPLIQIDSSSSDIESESIKSRRLKSKVSTKRKSQSRSRSRSKSRKRSRSKSKRVKKKSKKDHKKSKKKKKKHKKRKSRSPRRKKNYQSSDKSISPENLTKSSVLIENWRHRDSSSPSSSNDFLLDYFASE